MNKTPCAVCTVCGKTSHSITVVNNRCYVRQNGKQCKGVFQSAIGIDDWEVCPACSGFGSVENVRCDQCSGDGHLFIRKGR